MTFLRKSGDLNGWSWRTIHWTFRGEPSGSIAVKIATGSDGSDYYMELDYKTRSNDEDWRQILYRVKLEATPCRFGGKRWWFICPVARCRRRNCILYQKGDYFVCRKCAGLKYDSQNYTGKYSFLRNLFEAEAYEMTIKRWYWRGKPTRKHRRLIKMTRGMTEGEAMRACLAMMKA